MSHGEMAWFWETRALKCTDVPLALPGRLWY